MLRAAFKRIENPRVLGFVLRIPPPVVALTALLMSVLSLGLAAVATAQEDADLALLAQKTNNPLSDVWLRIAQNDTTLYDGSLLKGTPKVANSTKFQPVMPVPILDGEWNLIFRPVFQLQSLPFDSNLSRVFGTNPSQIEGDPSLLSPLSSPSGRTTGLGDTVLLSLVGPNRLDGFVWGVGPTAASRTRCRSPSAWGPSAC